MSWSTPGLEGSGNGTFIRSQSEIFLPLLLAWHHLSGLYFPHFHSKWRGSSSRRRHWLLSLLMRDGGGVSFEILFSIGDFVAPQESPVFPLTQLWGRGEVGRVKTGCWETAAGSLHIRRCVYWSQRKKCECLTSSETHRGTKAHDFCSFLRLEKVCFSVLLKWMQLGGSAKNKSNPPETDVRPRPTHSFRSNKASGPGVSVQSALRIASFLTLNFLRVFKYTNLFAKAWSSVIYVTGSVLADKTGVNNNHVACQHLGSRLTQPLSLLRLKKGHAMTSPPSWLRWACGINQRRQHPWNTEPHQALCLSLELPFIGLSQASTVACFLCFPLH